MMPGPVKFFKTIMGGTADQRAWVREQADSRGRLPPFQDGIGKTIWFVCVLGIPAVLLLWVAGAPVNVRGLVSIAWAIMGWVLALRQYRWLKSNQEFQALA